MLQKYLFLEILNSEDPKTKYEEFKNLANYNFLIYFLKENKNNNISNDENNIISDESNNSFNLLNNYEKIFINKFADYENFNFIGSLIEIRYVIEIDTNIVSYLDRLCKNNLVEEQNLDIQKMLDDIIPKHKYFKLGYNLYMLENILKGIDDNIILDVAKSVEYSFYPEKKSINNDFIYSIEKYIK